MSVPDDPYRFGFSAPGDEIPDVDPTDDFYRCSRCGTWTEKGEYCERCHPPARPPVDPDATMPYDPETDPF